MQRHSSREALDPVCAKLINVSTSTRSLFEGDLEYQMENDRRYVQDYFMPNDEDEQSRLQIMHQVFLFFFKSELTTVPLTAPTKILDIGTGTGEWAIGMGEIYPDAEVIGTDLSAIQPSAVPSNVYFEIWNAEEDEQWTEPQQSCDLIHFRSMSGSFYSWEVVYGRTHEHLKPGGWIEVLDCDPTHSTFGHLFPDDSDIATWWLAVSEAMEATRRDFSPLHIGAEYLKAVGFVDVEVKEYDTPLGAWPKDPETKNTAKLWLLTVVAGLEAISLRPLTRIGWSAEDVRKMCDKVRGELKRVAMDPEKAEGLSVKVKVLTGRKLRDGEIRSEESEQEMLHLRTQRGTSGEPQHGVSDTGREEATQFLRPPYDDNNRASEDTMRPSRT